MYVLKQNKKPVVDIRKIIIIIICRFKDKVNFIVLCDFKLNYYRLSNKYKTSHKNSNVSKLDK